MTKLKIGLIFGGKSGEHEVSLVSARSIYQAFDRKKYDMVLIGIDKRGLWHIVEPVKFKIGQKVSKNYKMLPPGDKFIVSKDEKFLYPIQPVDVKKISKIDVFFPITHGTFGEDGCLQGFLEMLGAAYVGPGVLGSAVGMDKDIMKRLFRENGLNTAKFEAIRFGDKSDLAHLGKKLGWPVFVKPANLGSSVGINKARNLKELKSAVNEAFKYDTKIIIEKAIIGREIECSVLGNENPVASVPGEIKLKPGHFYSYHAKYIADDIAAPNPVADLPKNLIKKIQETAIRVFKVLNCEGMGRVDFFLTPKGKLHVNEINTLPGFTAISMYPKMFEKSGISYSKLLDKLIQLAVDRKKRNNKLKRSY
jgi:D-alanine-D-alanine ligase